MKSSGEDAGKLVLRVVLGVLLLVHGIYKLQNGVGWMHGLLANHGLPSFLAYGAYVGEVLAPMLLILGLFTRFAGLIVVGHMTMAVLLMHTGDFALINKSGGWQLELQAFFFFNAIAVMLLGAGRYSLGGPYGRWN
ncbi:MAG: DoxX family protein [Burkholderiales bacterium]